MFQNQSKDHYVSRHLRHTHTHTHTQICPSPYLPLLPSPPPKKKKTNHYKTSLSFYAIMRRQGTYLLLRAGRVGEVLAGHLDGLVGTMELGLINYSWATRF